MAKTLTTKILLRNDTRANWTTNNPVLSKGEMGIEIDTGKFKFGVGVSSGVTSRWNDLPYGSTEKNVWYATSATSQSVNVVTTSSGDFTLSAGNMLVILFPRRPSGASTNSVYINVDGTGQKEVFAGNTNLTVEELPSDGCLPLVYTGSSFNVADLYTKGSGASYGSVKLSSAIDSTSGVTSGIAATPSAVKTVNDTVTALSARVDDIVEQGGEPNVIETVKVNGTALTPDANKAVDVTVPTKVSDLTNDAGYTTNTGTVTSVRVQATSPVRSSQNTAQTGTLNTTISLADNYGDTKNPYASKTKNYVLAAPSTANGAPSFRALAASDIPSITKSKISDFPTAVSAFTNDSGYQTASQVQSLIDTAVSSRFTYKGTVATTSALPTTGNKTGDVYHVTANDSEYAWTGSEWEELGGVVDLSNYYNKTQTDSKIAELAVTRIAAGSTNGYISVTKNGSATPVKAYELPSTVVQSTDQLILDCGSSTTNIS